MQTTSRTMRSTLAILSLLCSSAAMGATLERLSIEDMSLRSTVIVRGRISGCVGESRGSVIHTRCKVDVTERWKGSTGAQVEFLVPGGTTRGLTQTFTGTPKFGSGQDYVLFLWAGRSGTLQIIGLSQGVFDVKATGSKGATAYRAASSEVMLTASGQPVADEGVQMTVSALKARVTGALGGATK